MQTNQAKSPSSRLKIEHISTPSKELLEPIRSLMEQLTQRPSTLDQEQLRRLICDCASRLFIATIDDKVVGMVTLGIYSAPSGRKLWVEDLVVDSSARGKGIGRELIDYAISYAKMFAPCTLMLTSRPSRVEANQMYRSADFQSKQTNVYQMKIER